MNLSKNRLIALAVLLLITFTLCFSLTGCESETGTAENSSDEVVQQDAAKESSVDEVSESESEVGQHSESEEELPEIMTMFNSPDLVDLLTSDDYDTFSAFEEKYYLKGIMFPASIDRIVSRPLDRSKAERTYSKRLDFIITYGDYSPDAQVGPTFILYDMPPSPSWIELHEGDNIMITAVVLDFDYDEGLFYLIPDQIIKR